MEARRGARRLRHPNATVPLANTCIYSSNSLIDTTARIWQPHATLGETKRQFSVIRGASKANSCHRFVSPPATQT